MGAGTQDRGGPLGASGDPALGERYRVRPSPPRISTKRVWLVQEHREVFECDRCGEEIEGEHECREEALEVLRRKYARMRDAE
jgi:predicted RNA-binding Zn-ribbon protein involved in translation (DUF1610 family)